VLAKSPDGVFHEAIKPFEKAVNDSIKAKLTQEEFDALVSLCFNIGVRAFSKSSVVREINKDKHKSGDAKQRKVAIDAIESAFGKFNKSGGKVSHGLTKRRKAEADSFLAAARAELARLEKEAVPLRLSPLK
jgi:lysozyme